MDIGLIHAHYDQDHLEEVKAEMAVRGAPVIKAVWMECYGVWAALEGCHRIRAAKELGLIPEIDEVEYSDSVTTAEIGLDDFGGSVYAIAEIADQVCRAEIIRFEDEQ